MIRSTIRSAALAAALCAGALLGGHASSVEAQEYIQGVDLKAQDAFRTGLASALRKVPKCNPYQILDSGECCPSGFVSLGGSCARIAPNQCAAVAIDNPESCVLDRCARYVRTEKRKEKVKDDSGAEVEVDKDVEVPCEPWVGGERDLTCELDTMACKKELLQGQPPRWCGDFIKAVPVPPAVDAAGKPVPGAPSEKYVRCKAGSEGCELAVRECTESELQSGKSDGAGPCAVGEFIDNATGKCTKYGCPAACRTADGRCSKCGPDYITAVDEFKKATTLDKRFYEAYFNLGMAYERQGKYQEAIAAYEQAKAIDAQDEREKGLQLSAQAYIARSMLAQAQRLTEAGEFDKAKALREQAKGISDSILGQDPDNPQNNVALALYWLQTGDLATAEDFVKKALRANREDTIALNIRGLINLRNGRYDIARWILEEKVLALDPANPEGWANLGMAFVSLGDLPRAVQSFKTAVTLNPNSVSARLNLGAIYLEYLNYRDAEKQYAEALKREGENLEALTGYALSLEGRRDPKKAAEIYEKVLAKDASRSAIIVRLAIIYNKAPFNDGPKAITYWKRYLTAVGVDPDKAAGQADAMKAELDATRAALKGYEKAPKKPSPDWKTQKEALVKKEAEQATKWKNLVAIVSRIQEIEQGMQLEKEAKEKEAQEKAAPAPAPEGK